jgi:AraC-like DNA-binding protein
MTGSDPAGNSQDPLLKEIREAHRRKLQAEEDLRTLIAYAREFIRPRPYRLIDLAEAAGMSVSGVRTMYARSDVERVAALLRHDTPPGSGT